MKKFSSDKEIFVMSDLHFGHSKDFILNPRNFLNSQEAIESITKGWNSTVSNNDIGFLLGDNVVGAGTGDAPIDLFENIISNFNYKELYIMPGNHFSGYLSFLKKFKDSAEHLDDFSFKINYYGKTVYLIPNLFEVLYKNIPFTLSHYPILSYNYMSNDGIHVFGHVHNNLKNSKIGSDFLSGRVFEVTPEVIGNRPASLTSIKNKLDGVKPIQVDYHS